MATIRKYENGFIAITADEQIVPSAHDAIVNGALLWDEGLKEYVYK